MSEMLSDSSEFKKLDMKSGKGINSLLQQEDTPSKFLKKIKMSKSDHLYKELYLRGSQPNAVCGATK